MVIKAFFNNFSMRTKLFLIFGSFVAISLLISTIGIVAQRKQEEFSNVRNHLYAFDSQLAKTHIDESSVSKITRQEEIEEITTVLQHDFAEINASLARVETSSIRYDTVVYNKLTTLVDQVQILTLDVVSLQKNFLSNPNAFSQDTLLSVEKEIANNITRLYQYSQTLQFQIKQLEDVHQRNVQNIMLPLAAGNIVWAVLVSLLVSRNFLDRFKKLTHTAISIKEGDLSSSLIDNAQDEIGQLSRSIDQMKSNLLTIYRENKTIIRSLPEPIFTLDKNGIIQSVNPATEALLGYKESELIGKSIQEIIVDATPSDERKGNGHV